MCFNPFLFSLPLTTWNRDSLAELRHKKRRRSLMERRNKITTQRRSPESCEMMHVRGQQKERKLSSISYSWPKRTFFGDEIISGNSFVFKLFLFEHCLKVKRYLMTTNFLRKKFKNFEFWFKNIFLLQKLEIINVWDF